MFCRVSQRKFSDFTTSLEKAGTHGHVPFMGAFELTYRCNLSCRHCYCNLGLNDARKKEELATAEVRRILDEIADAGCFWLLLTGGEVLVREDFADIYMHAIKRGMIVEVFTNATLLDDSIARLFSEFSPLGVDISIYGSSPLVHDKVTGVKGSFERTMAGIACLKRHNVKIFLKTVLMTLNYRDLDGMRTLAMDLGARFHFDTIISPRTDGGMSPAQHRLDVNFAVGYELDKEEDFRSCEDVFAGHWNKGLGEAFNCGAGVYAFNINPYGHLSPCTMFSSFQHPLNKVSFKDAWEKVVAEYGIEQNSFIPDECRSCSMVLLCSRCNAWAEAETGSLYKKVDYPCAYAKCLEKKFFAKKKEAEHAKETV